MQRGDTNHGDISAFTTTESDATYESQVIKTKDGSEEKSKKLKKESKRIAVISPLKGVGVNSNRDRGLQLTRELFQLFGDSENTPKGAADTEIDWIKLFRDLVPHLPIDDRSWTFFAIDLLHISHEQCGSPKDVSNEMNRIKQKNKQLDLAYLELLNNWYSKMGCEARLEHIEIALKRMDNKVIMEEFERIKDNPPTRKIFAQNTETSLMSWRQNEQFPLTQRQLFAFAQHESTHEIAETHDILYHRNFSAASQTQTSQSFLPDPSRLALQQLQQRSKEQYYDNNAYHKVRCRGSKVKKKNSRRRSKEA
ncbi:uncharacterized protein LOC128553210 [Mercenaria mercenaria]|uniref:uncharacterized protein LOC128553210 n=1 Tax=Mercenaria mercenaria TaxID=6596 RepID=UPI00234ED5CD|nr:uncharacterized protein LOC128553210 [Mercenaria mercenaria]